ncbi:MAG: hypothetical protein HYY84_14530 [Deltaproteobacteria bacterium]|nr:hypothetical protein [Deltaproteobacteria bacterium]
MTNETNRSAGWSRGKILVTAVSVFVVGALGGWGGAYLYYRQFFPKPREAPDPAKAPKRDIKLAAHTPTLGPPDAKVTVVTHSDFQ